MYQYISPYHRPPAMYEKFFHEDEHSGQNSIPWTSKLRQHFNNRLNSVLSRYASPRPRSIQDFGSLSILPPELLLCIEEFLPHHASVCLALCNYSFMNLLGHKAISRIHSNTEEKLALIHLLERDLPTAWLSCVRCQKLHRPGVADLSVFDDALLDRQLRARIRARRCQQEDDARGSNRYFHPWIRFEKVQMAMKLYNRGLKSAESLESLGYQGCDIRDRTHVRSFEACIKDNRLFIRSEHWYLHPPSRDPITIPRCLFVQPCAHFDDCLEASAIWNDLMKESINALQSIRAYESESRSHCYQPWTTTKLAQCRYCATEYQIACGSFFTATERRKYRGWHALVVSKWMCLGKGQSPKERDWIGHLRRKDGTADRSTVYDPMEPGMLMRAFDAGRQCSSLEYKPTWTDVLEKRLNG